ncbi:MAG: beta-propeller fold lactonase family protein [Piscinibacter sp.]
MGTTVVYVSNADSAQISVLALDEANGELRTLQTLPCGGMVMPLALRPDRQVLYAGIRSEPWRVLALRISPGDGRLAPLAEAPLPASMAHLSVDASGHWLFSASYPGDVLALAPLDAEGRPGASLRTWPTQRHAHAMCASPDNQFVFATSLGGGLVMQFRFDAASGMLTPNEPSAFEARAGAGPRHLAFHPNGQLVYLLNELDASVDVLALDAQRGTLAPRQSVSLLPPGFTGEPWGAELRLTADARFLYASERRSSTLAGFAVDAQGALAPIGHWPTQAQPRGFAVTPSGRWLVAAGQSSHAVGVHRIDADTGTLDLRHTHAVGRNPNWVEAITLP